MKITKKNLRILIEKFLFEEESGTAGGGQSSVKSDDLHKKDEIIELVDLIREFLYNHQDFVNSISDNKQTLIDVIDSVPGLQQKDKILCKEMIEKLSLFKNDALSMNYVYDTDKSVQVFIDKYQNSPVKKDREVLEKINELIDLVLTQENKERFKEFITLVKKFKSGSNIIEKGYNVFVFVQIMVLLLYVTNDFNDYLVSNRNFLGIKVEDKDLPGLEMNYVLSSTVIDVLELIKSFMHLMGVYIKLGESPNDLKGFVDTYESKSVKDFKRQSNFKDAINTKR